MTEVIQSLEYLGHSVSQELLIIDLLEEQSFLISWEARGGGEWGQRIVWRKTWGTEEASSVVANIV